VAHYIRESGLTYVGYRELVNLLLGDTVIKAEYGAMRRGGYKGALEDIVPKMVGYFSKCWTDNIGYDMTEYREELVRDRIDGVYAYRVKS
jgi:hypothetical protein